MLCHPTVGNFDVCHKELFASLCVEACGQEAIVNEGYRGKLLFPSKKKSRSEFPVLKQQLCGTLEWTADTVQTLCGPKFQDSINIKGGTISFLNNKAIIAMKQNQQILSVTNRRESLMTCQSPELSQYPFFINPLFPRTYQQM